MKKLITSHTIVRNEDKFIWFALNSVIDFVDKMLVFETGSTDQTKEIIKSIKSPKIIFESKGQLNADQLVRLRQEQLDRTQTEWFLILDGDEIWWEESIKSVIKLIKKADKNVWGIITPSINCIGDICHYQEKRAGKYEFAGRKGHLAVRAIRKTIPGLHVEGTYPLEGYKDENNKLITDYADRLVFLDKPYLHTTNLSRSSQKASQVISREKKYELGTPFAKNFKYPQVFYQNFPSIIPSPWVKQSGVDTIRSAVQTPIKKLRRRIIK